MHSQTFFDYSLPSTAGASGAAGAHPGKGSEDDADKGEGEGKKKKDQTVRTQMVGESPGDDLGYDPKTIPVEDIPDED